MRTVITLLLLLTMITGFAQDNIEDTQAVASNRSSILYSENGRMGLKKNMRKYITPAIFDTLYRVTQSTYVGKRFSSTKQQSLWGVIDNDGNVVIPFKYITLRYNGPYFLVGYAEKNRLLFGVYSSQGEEVISPKYKSINFISADIIQANSLNKTLLFDGSGGKIGEFVADSVNLIGDQFVKLYQMGKAGLSTLQMQTLVEPRYMDIMVKNGNIFVKKYPKWSFIKGYDTLSFDLNHVESWNGCFISTAGNKSHLIDINQRSISDSYDEIIVITKNLAVVRNKLLWGAINNHGKEIIPGNYDKIIANEEFVATRIPSNIPKWMIFDLYGFPKTKLLYDSVISISEGRIPVQRNGKWGYLDRYGVEIISPIFDSAGTFKKGMSTVKFFGESGLIDRSGKWVVPPTEDNIIDFNEHVILHLDGQQYRVSGLDGELIYFSGNKLELIEDGINEYDSTNNFIRKISWTGIILNDVYSGESIRTGGSGLTIFRENAKYGFKDQLGRIIIANRYEDVKPFHQRYAAVKLNSHWGFINLDEIIVIQPRYDSVGHFVEETCITKKQGRVGVVNRKGKEIIANSYEEIMRLIDGNFRVKQSGKWGVLNNSGAVIIHPKYDELLDTGQGYYIVERNQHYGTISNNGVNLIPTLYDYIGFEPASKTLIIKESYKKGWAPLQKTQPDL